MISKEEDYFTLTMEIGARMLLWMTSVQLWALPGGKIWNWPFRLINTISYDQ